MPDGSNFHCNIPLWRDIFLLFVISTFKLTIVLQIARFIVIFEVAASLASQAKLAFRRIVIV